MILPWATPETLDVSSRHAARSAGKRTVMVRLIWQIRNTEPWWAPAWPHELDHSQLPYISTISARSSTSSGGFKRSRRLERRALLMAWIWSTAISVLRPSHLH